MRINNMIFQRYGDNRNILQKLDDFIYNYKYFILAMTLSALLIISFIKILPWLMGVK